MVTKENVLEFLGTVGTASIDDISLGLSIEKFGKGSAYNLVKELKEEGKIVREGNLYKLPETKTASTQNNNTALMQEMLNVFKKASSQPQQDEWERTNAEMNDEISEETANELEKFILMPDEDVEAAKEIIGFATGTFIDSLFLKPDGSALGGLPIESQNLVTGLPGSGKSILFGEEIPIRVAAAGIEVMLITSEDMWKSPGQRFDLQSRCRQKADILGLDWNTIKENLFIIDTVNNDQLNSWGAFADVYRLTVEMKNIKLVVVDSVTALETYRGALKVRLLELARYNQANSVTGIFINQRADDKWDSYSIAGGIGLAHNMDATLILDFGRLYYGDQIDQLGGKRGTFVREFRILDCRMCNYVRERLPVDITPQGFVKLIA